MSALKPQDTRALARGAIIAALYTAPRSTSQNSPFLDPSPAIRTSAVPSNGMNSTVA